MDNYYTKIQTDARIQQAKDDLAQDIEELARDVESIETDISDTYSKEEVDTKLALKANIADVYSKDDVDTKLSLKANLSDVYGKDAIDGLLATKASTAETASLQTQITAISSDLTDDFYDKDEVDGKLADKASTATTDAISAAVDTKQDILVSGTNIKTINNQSLLGSGNIDITGGTADAYTKAETDALLADKQDVSGMSNYATTATVSTKADITALTQVNGVLTAHTSDSVIHVTQANKNAWNAKLDPSALNGYATEQWVEGKGYLTGYTETDPIFTGSPAYSITNADKTNWDTVSTKADTSALTAVNNALTAHTDNATIHVSATEKNNWNNKLDQSDLDGYATEQWVEGKGYLTGYTETDPVFVSSPAYSITNADKTTWNGAATNASQALTQLGGYSLLKISKTAFDALTTKNPSVIYLVYQD